MLDISLVQQCANGVDYPIVHAIVQQESSFNPLAINVNKAAAIKQPKTFNEAVYKAKELIARGYSIDMGLGQINSSNLKWLNLSVEQVFNPCTNLAALKTIYLSCYNQAGNAGNAGNGTRIQRAFSCYNTGNISSGFSNGYVNKVTRYLNNLIVNNGGINRKSLPKNREDLAIYASSLQAANSGQEDSINNGVENDQVDEKNIADEPKQYSTWDAFKEF